MYRSKAGALGVEKLNSADADSETPRRLPHATYVLHRTGCSQAQDQLLREGRQWPDSCRSIDFRHTSGAGPLDALASAAVERGDGSDDVHRLDLRSPQAACCHAEGRAPADAAGHCRCEKEERPHRRQQDLRLLAMRFLPESHMASTAIRERRRTLRYRNLLV